MVMEEARSHPFSLMLTAGLNTVANVENAQLAVQPIQITHLFATPSAVGQTVQRRYSRDLLLQTYKIMGSADILGNPVGLFLKLRTGVRDFVMMPVSGMRHSMHHFGLGVMRGTQSLLSNTLGGAVDTVGRICNGASRGLQSLAEDEFTNFHPEQGAFRGMVWGASGLFLCPILGARKEGLVGFGKGIVSGLLGAVAKPMSGAVYTLSGAMRYLRGMLSLQYGLSDKRRMLRKRPPRFFPHGPYSPLKPYRKEESVGEEILSLVERGRYRSDGYVHHEHIASILRRQVPCQPLAVEVLQLGRHQRRRRAIRTTRRRPLPHGCEPLKPQRLERLVRLALLGPCIAAAHRLEHQVVRVGRDAGRKVVRR